MQWNSSLSTSRIKFRSNIIFPNPAVQNSTIELRTNQNPIAIELFNVTGKKINSFSAKENKIKAPNVPGIYFLRLSFFDGLSNVKLLVE